MKQYKAIILDLDGVICFTDKYHYLAWKQLADRLDIPFTEQDNNLLRGVSRADSLEIILRKSDKTFSDEEKQKMLDEKNEIYREYLKQMSPTDLSEEVIYTLLTIISAGFKVAIGSSSKNTRFILEKLGILKLFDAISDGTNITKSKPDPEVFIKAASFIDEKPEMCLVVEDAKAGIDAAYNGGFDSCGLLDGKDYSKTTYPLSSFKDILGVLNIK